MLIKRKKLRLVGTDTRFTIQLNHYASVPLLQIVYALDFTCTVDQTTQVHNFIIVN